MCVCVTLCSFRSAEKPKTQTYTKALFQTLVWCLFSDSINNTYIMLDIGDLLNFKKQ